MSSRSRNDRINLDSVWFYEQQEHIESSLDFLVQKQRGRNNWEKNNNDKNANIYISNHSTRHSVSLWFSIQRIWEPWNEEECLPAERRLKAACIWNYSSYWVITKWNLETDRNDLSIYFHIQIQKKREYHWQKSARALLRDSSHVFFLQ